jgi:NAD(P)-dependent dehydrogenase (short-subunit alcohol dehydrogenase family)
MPPQVLLEGVSKAMALDLARYGIRVNTIAPTFIETSLTKPFFEDQVFQRSGDIQD